MNRNKTEIVIWLSAIIQSQRLQTNYTSICTACFRNSNSSSSSNNNTPCLRVKCGNVFFYTLYGLIFYNQAIKTAINISVLILQLNA